MKEKQRNNIALMFDLKNMLKLLINNISKELNINKIIILFKNNHNKEFKPIEFSGFNSMALQSLKLNQEDYIIKRLNEINDFSIVLTPAQIQNTKLKNIITNDIKSIFFIKIVINNDFLGFIICFSEDKSKFDNYTKNYLFNYLKMLNNVLKDLYLSFKKINFEIVNPVTLIFNQDFFYESLYRQIVESKTGNTEFCLVFLEIIDYAEFEKLNGKKKCEDTLKKISLFLTKNLRKIDICSMLFNEILSIILPELSFEKVNYKMKKILEDFYLQNSELNIKLRYVISKYPEDGQTCEKIIRNTITKFK